MGSQGPTWDESNTMVVSFALPQNFTCSSQPIAPVSEHFGLLLVHSSDLQHGACIFLPVTHLTHSRPRTVINCPQHQRLKMPSTTCAGVSFPQVPELVFVAV